MKNNLKTVFFGTPEFSNIILQKLIDFDYKPSLVITAANKPVGRKKQLTSSPVKLLAKKNNIPILQPEKLNEAISYKLKAKSWDLFIVAAYGKIIPGYVLKIPKYGALNIHPSVLPFYRGPSPIQATILNGDKKTGVSIIKMDEKMDHGPILTNQKLKITNQDTYETLGNKLFEMGAGLLIDILPKYTEGEIKSQEQNHKKATYTKIIKKEDGHINWSCDAMYIERQLRAFTPWPGIYTLYNNKRLKILTLIPKSPNIVTPEYTTLGKVTKYENGFAVQTDNGLIVPLKVQIEGKKPQTAQEFLRGYSEIIGSTLAP